MPSDLEKFLSKPPSGGGDGDVEAFPGKGEPQGTLASTWKESKYGFRIRDAVTPDTGKPTVEREDGALWYGPEQGNTGDPGWFTPKGERTGSNLDPSLWEQIKEGTRYGIQKSILGAQQLGTQANAMGAQLGTVGPIYIPQRYEIPQEGKEAAAQEATRNAMEARQRFEERSGGGFLPSVVAEVVDPINWVGGVAGKAVSAPLRGASLLSKVGAGALEGALQALPAAALRPTGEGESRLANIGTETVFGGLTGGAIGGVAGGVEARQVAKAAAKEAAGKVAQESGEQIAEKDLGTLLQKASGSGFGGKAARDKLADLAAVNPEAKAAAEKLGMDLPVDVFTDNPQIREAAGISRAIRGSEPSAVWRQTVAESLDQADEVMKGIDAQFIEGQVSPSEVSSKIKSSLLGTREQIAQEAKSMYENINQSVPKGAPVELGNLKTTLEEIRNEVGSEAFRPEEKQLLAWLTSKEKPTYGGLLRKKDEIGQAIAGKQSPFSSVTEGSLKRLYGALAEDQLQNVGKIGGEELRTQLRGANLLYAKERALGKRIVSVFGKEFEGSVAGLMKRAITSSAEGETKAFSTLMKTIPDEYKKEAITTALASVTRAGKGGGFGMSEFAKLYPSLRANKEVYKQIREVLGPEADEVLRSLYVVSKRMTEARATVPTTGAANQALVTAMGADSMIGRILKSAYTRGAATAGGAVGMGPFGAAAAAEGTERLANALGKSSKQRLAAIGELFNSEEFRRLAIEASTKANPAPKAIREVAKSPKFAVFAKMAGIPKEIEERYIWLVNSMRPTEQNQQE